MRLDTGVPVLHRGVADRAISRAMVDIDAMYSIILWLVNYIDLLMREENRVICEGCLVIQIAGYFL